MYILKSIAKYHDQLQHLQAIELDYVRTADEMSQIYKLNQELQALGYPIQIGVRLMNTIIKTETLDKILNKSYQVNKLFLTVTQDDILKKDVEAVQSCLEKFECLKKLAI